MQLLFQLLAYYNSVELFILMIFFFFCFYNCIYCMAIVSNDDNSLRLFFFCFCFIILSNCAGQYHFCRHSSHAKWHDCSSFFFSLSRSIARHRADFRWHYSSFTRKYGWLSSHVYLLDLFLLIRNKYDVQCVHALLY